jgi:hypothetical protein
VVTPGRRRVIRGGREELTELLGRPAILFGSTRVSGDVTWHTSPRRLHSKRGMSEERSSSQQASIHPGPADAPVKGRRRPLWQRATRSLSCVDVHGGWHATLSHLTVTERQKQSYAAPGYKA